MDSAPPAPETTQWALNRDMASTILGIDNHDALETMLARGSES